MIEGDRARPGEYTIRCDKCSYFETYEGAGFRNVNEQAKGDGWRIRKEGEEFVDICPACSQPGGEEK